MAPGVRRQSHANRVSDSESGDDHDVRARNISRTSAQPIDLSDEEDNVVPPPRSPLRQNTPLRQNAPAARHPVEELLQTRGVRPQTQWLESCLNELAALEPGFTSSTVARQAELCFGQFLMADLNVAGAASLPPSMHTLHNTELPGPFVLQVDEVIDIGNSLRNRYHEKLAGPGRTLKLSMTDGVQRVSGMEYRPIKALQVLSPAGMKISLKNVCVKRGLLMLVPEVLEILGGVVEHLETARLRAVQVINKPPRGCRTRQGMMEPPLAERARQAAWPANLSEGGAEPLSSNHPPDQRRSNSVSSLAPGSPPSNSVRPAIQPGEERQHMDHQPAELSGQSVQVSHIQRAVRMASVPQEERHQPMVQNQFTNPSRQAQDVSGVHSVGLETAQQPEHYQPTQEDQAAEPIRESIRVSGIPSARSEHVHQLEKRNMVQQGQSAGSSRQFVSHTVNESSSTQVSAESSGQFSSTPTFGRLSLQSRRLVQSKLPVSPAIRQPQAREWPLLSTGGNLETLMDLDDSQESYQQTAALSTPLSQTDTFKEGAPFTYLAVLKERTNTQSVVRGKVKCVITGVVSFKYKDCDEFKLQVHIEDGSYITVAFVQHQLVQRLVGYAPREVILGLQHPNTHQQMMQNMLRFQKFLEQFEGLMDVEFLDSSSIPNILEMSEGIQTSGINLLLDRVQHQLSRQPPNSNVHIPMIDLSTP